LWRDLENAFDDDAWTGWPQDWPELDRPFRPIERQAVDNLNEVQSIEQPSEVAESTEESRPAAAPSGYQRFYSHQTSFHRDADGNVTSWAEGSRFFFFSSSILSS
jgi:hypothetical protein